MTLVAFFKELMEDAHIEPLDNIPKNTIKAYKLFRINPKNPGNLYPLFVDADKAIPIGKWVDAEIGPMEDGKVKSKIGKLAFRPGWNSGDLPIATDDHAIYKSIHRYYANYYRQHPKHTSRFQFHLL